jgi:MFS family permease
MSRKFNLHAFLTKAIAWFKTVLAVPTRFWSSHSSFWSWQIHGNPIVSGILVSVIAGYISIALPPILRPWPFSVNWWSLLGCLLSYYLAALLMGHYLWKFRGNDNHSFAIWNFCGLIPFLVVEVSKGAANLWLLRAFGLCVTLETVLTFRWLWNSLPERYREVFAKAVTGYVKALPGYIRQDWVLRRQAKQYLNYIGLFAAALLLFYDPADPNYGQFTSRLRVLSVAVGIGFLVTWFIRWIRESDRRWSDIRRQAAAAEHPEAAIVINLGYPMLITYDVRLSARSLGHDSPHLLMEASSIALESRLRPPLRAVHTGRKPGRRHHPRHPLRSHQDSSCNCIPLFTRFPPSVKNDNPFLWISRTETVRRKKRAVNHQIAHKAVCTGPQKPVNSPLFYENRDLLHSRGNLSRTGFL